MAEHGSEPLFQSCWNYPCRDDGCPFDLAADAPDDCARTVEAGDWRKVCARGHDT